MSHTPKPWKIAYDDEMGHYRIVHDGWTIADGITAESEANARLIAAAPDLLEACEQVKRCYSGDAYVAKEVLPLIEDAITKATKRTTNLQLERNPNHDRQDPKQRRR